VTESRVLEDGTKRGTFELRPARQRVSAAGSLAARPCPQSESPSQILPRAGVAKKAVFQALANAERPLQAREIHAAAEEMVGMPLSWNTVKDCLHKHARRPGSPVQRVGHGRYRSRGPFDRE
jgi:hypothetical protein